MATSLETILNFNHIAERIVARVAQLDYRSLWNLEQTNSKWARYIKEPKLLHQRRIQMVQKYSWSHKSKLHPVQKWQLTVVSTSRWS